MMKAYLAHPLITRDVFLAEIKQHQDSDSIIQGVYDSVENGKFRGCAVGCSIHSINSKLAIDISYLDHTAYETYLGIPTPLALLEDKIFEGLPPNVAKKWPLRFASAIQSGADLDKITTKFIPWVLRNVVLASARDASENVKNILQRMAAGYETDWAHDISYKAMEEARSSAASAASATSAAAAFAAYTAAFADAVDVVDSAIDVVAAAVARVRKKTEQTAYAIMADQLLILLSDAPVELDDVGGS
jgi:hypothetical protein